MRLLAQQKHIFMGLGASIHDAFWHWIGLCPDDVLSQPPAIDLEREGYPPRDAAEVLGLEGA